MAGEVERSVGATGPRKSLLLILPRAWTCGVRLGKGDRVRVLYNDVALIVPPGVSSARVDELRRVVGGAVA